MKKFAVLLLLAAIVIVLAFGCGKRTANQSGPKSSVPVTEKSTTAPAGPDSKKSPEKNTAKSDAAPLPAKPTAKDVLVRMAEVYKSVSNLKMDGTIYASMHLAGEVKTDEGPVTLRFKRPNKLRLVTGRGENSVTIVSNGKHLYAYVAREKLYQKSPAPKNLTDAPQIGGDGLNTLALLDGRDISGFIRSAKLLSSEKLNGVDTYVISHTMQMDRDAKSSVKEKIWIGKKDFLIRQISSSHTVSAEALSKAADGEKKAKGPLVMSQKTVVTSIAANGPLPSNTFRFVPPSGAKEFDPKKMKEQAQAAPPTPPDVTGKVAPEFALSDLAGKKIALSDYRGKTVIVVFWTTMSKTAKEGIIEVQKLQDDLIGSGVVTLGINLDRNKETVTKFVEENGITFPTLFGFEDTFTAANAYSLMHLPTAFVIGGDGKVKGRIIGPSPADEIKTELAKLGVS